MRTQTKLLAPANRTQSILVFQSPYSRALNIGFIQKKGKKEIFVPGRLNFGTTRMEHTMHAMTQTLETPFMKKIIKKYKPSQISTVTVIREALAYHLPLALAQSGVKNYYGDAFVGATHNKKNKTITTDYAYENLEGLTPNGLWIIADSICMGRNLHATMTSLLQKFHPKEIVYLCPIASRRGIAYIGALSKKKRIPTSFVAWGALFGVGENLYDMPWGHPDTIALDKRDQELFIRMYADKLCVGGDFGNCYFSPTVANNFYDAQLQEHHITPHVPKVNDVRKIYTSEEILSR